MSFSLWGLECKSRNSGNTWSNRQIWPWSTKRSRAKANRVFPREHTVHSKLMGCSLPGSSTHGIFQARVLEWGAITFSEELLRVGQFQHKFGTALKFLHLLLLNVVLDWARKCLHHWPKYLQIRKYSCLRCYFQATQGRLYGSWETK